MLWIIGNASVASLYIYRIASSSFAATRSRLFTVTKTILFSVQFRRFFEIDTFIKYVRIRIAFIPPPSCHPIRRKMYIKHYIYGTNYLLYMCCKRKKVYEPNFTSRTRIFARALFYAFLSNLEILALIIIVIIMIRKWLNLNVYFSATAAKHL